MSASPFRICPVCGHHNPAAEESCLNCGAWLAELPLDGLPLDGAPSNGAPEPAPLSETLIETAPIEPPAAAPEVKPPLESTELPQSLAVLGEDEPLPESAELPAVPAWVEPPAEDLQPPEPAAPAVDEAAASEAKEPLEPAPAGEALDAELPISVWVDPGQEEPASPRYVPEPEELPHGLVEEPAGLEAADEEPVAKPWPFGMGSETLGLGTIPAAQAPAPPAAGQPPMPSPVPEAVFSDAPELPPAVPPQGVPPQGVVPQRPAPPLPVAPARRGATRRGTTGQWLMLAGALFLALTVLLYWLLFRSLQPAPPTPEPSTAGLRAVVLPGQTAVPTPVLLELIASETPGRSASPATVTPWPTNTPLPFVSSTPTRTPTRTPTQSASWDPCPGYGYLSRLFTGDQASVSYDPPLNNNVRQSPGLDSPILGVVTPGEVVQVLDGPQCNDSMIWWYIRSTRKDLTGWTAEGDAEDYWLLPSP